MIGSAKDAGLISRAVREALGTLVSPQICEQLFSRSLRTQGLASIPESGTQIGEWLEAGLRPEIETVVGTDAADLVMMQQGPIAAYAAISVPKQAAAKANAPLAAPARRRSSRPPRQERDPFASDEPERPTDLRLNPGQTDWTSFELAAPPISDPFGRGLDFSSAPPTGRVSALSDSDPGASVITLPPSRPISDPPEPANDVSMYTARPQAPDADMAMDQVPHALPAVLAATSDMGDFEALRRYLGSTAAVAHIPDLVGLLDALDEPGLVEPIVLIDCQRPTVHTTSVAALGEDLPRGTTVVLWGADENMWSQIDRDRSPGCRWVRCSREATTSDVGSLCAMLIG